MSTTFASQNTLEILISYLKSHPDIAQEMYEDLVLGKSMTEVDNQNNPVTCQLSSSTDVDTYMSQLYAD